MKNPRQNDQRRLMMMHDPIPKVIFKMAIPTIIAFLINSIYSLADTYFVSGLGTQATAAVSVNSSLDQLIMMTGSLLAVGANSFIARLLGQGDDRKASQVLSTAFFPGAVSESDTDGVRFYFHYPHGQSFGCNGHLPAILHRLCHLCTAGCPLYGYQLRHEPVPAQ